jgi:hypothetical protein
MRIGEGAWGAKRELCDGEGACAALGRMRKRPGRRMLTVEVKIRLASPLWIYRSTELRSPGRTPCVH